MRSKIVGSVFILIGAAIGAGMLALPLVSAALGFRYATILLIIIWLLMTLTALMTLEVNLAFKPYQNSFSTMARETLGRTGQIITWITYLLLLYATTASYIAGNASLLDELLKTFFNINVPSWIDATGFTLVFGGAVFLSTRAVDYFARFLLSIKGFLLIIVLAVLMPYIDLHKLAVRQDSVKYVWAAAPIFINAFGFHFVIPSISNYCNNHARTLKKIIILSSTIPLFIYIIWLLASFGIIPLTGNLSFTSIAHEQSSVGGFVHTLGSLADNKYVWFSINGFSNIAMTTSFLGVGLGLFDFLADGFKRKNNYFGRLQTALITFIPPLIFALFCKDGFIVALEYSAFFAVILEIFLPAFMVYKLRQNPSLQSSYRVPVNEKLLLIILSILGSFIMTLVVANRLGLLSVLK